VQLYAIGKALPPRELAAAGMQAMSVAFSSDGSRLASGESSGNARLWDVASGKELAVLRGQYGGIMRIAFAQGDTAVVCGGSEIKVWDLDHLPGRVNVAGHAGAVKSLTFSSDGKQLHAADTTGQFGGYDAATGQRLSGGTVSVTTPSTVAVSPRGSWFAASVKDGLLIHNAKTAAEHKLELPGQTIFTIAFSADEQFVSAGAITGELTVWKIEGQEKLPQVSGKGGFAFSQQFAPSGKQLAFGKDGLVQIYDLAEKTIFTPWTEKFSGMLTAIAYSPDGSLLAVGSTGLNSGDVRVYDLKEKRERLRITGAGRESMVLAISPDNRRLAAVSHSSGMQSTVRLYELETGREVLSLPMPRGMCSALAFSPDGRRIATATMPSLDPLAFAQPGKTPAEIQIWDAPPARE
jgi:WD40 repeat protein